VVRFKKLGAWHEDDTIDENFHGEQVSGGRANISITIDAALVNSKSRAADF
jgi:hypothetical protein